MEKECNVVTLNGVEYTEIKRIIDGGNTYVILVNMDNKADFCIKKLTKKDNVDYIIGLDNEEEFNKVLNLVTEDFKN